MSVGDLKRVLYDVAGEVDDVAGINYPQAIEINGRVISGMDLVLEALNSAVTRGKLVREEMEKEHLAVNGTATALDDISSRLNGHTQTTNSESLEAAARATKQLADNAGNIGANAVEDTDRFTTFIGKISALVAEFEGEDSVKFSHKGMVDVYDSEILGLGGNAANIRSAADNL